MTCENSLCEMLGYHFRDSNLLRQALTHKSYSNERAGGAEPDNERLEFLGDAVLDLAVSCRIFGSFPELPEGELTRIRAEVVNEKGLAAVGRRLSLGTCLRLGRGENRSGGREKESLLADAMEALLGAIFCDGGFESVQPVVDRLFADAITEAAQRKAGIDFKTRLQELLQARFALAPVYVLLRAEGPDHQRLYTVEVRFRGEGVGIGQGRTKKAAEQEAARSALGKLET